MHDFVEGLRQALQLILAGNAAVVDSTLTTLQFAFVTTAIGVIVGLPLGCVLGLGRSRAARTLRGLANAVARVPPVAAGVLVVLLLQRASPWGGGPLADLQWGGTSKAAYMAQAMLAAPIVTVLTAAAVQGVSPGLLEQARAYGASGPHRALLAVREARRAVLAGVATALGVTITAIGAIAVVGAGPDNTSGGAPTLAMGAFVALSRVSYGSPEAFDPHGALTAGNSLAVAYATVLMGLFVVIAAIVTLLQEKRSTWIPGLS